MSASQGDGAGEGAREGAAEGVGRGAESTAHIGIVTVSDRATRGEYQDRGGPAIREYLGEVLRSPWEAEARLVETLVRGTNVKEAADAFSVTQATIRSQLKSVFLKTGARSQADLVRRVLSDLAGLPTSAI